MLSEYVEVEFVLPLEMVGLDTEALLRAGPVEDEEPPPVADHPVVGHVRGVVVPIYGVLLMFVNVVVLLEFPYEPVKLAEAELAGPVDRVAELLK
ncbi:hypothetical protein SLS53_008746 [Cytospora paraplurivora]|uniref:Uncharacterized protein n=1 Tax=Cytospora paraplurivora TaxID=2898453 RepID=A0AAN9TX56_9PEZI